MTATDVIHNPVTCTYTPGWGRLMVRTLHDPPRPKRAHSGNSQEQGAIAEALAVNRFDLGIFAP